MSFSNQARPIIAIDVDDVLADNAAGFIAFSNERFGTQLTVDDYEEHWARLWQVDDDELLRRADVLHTSGVIAKYTHNESALPVLQKLSENYELVILTARRRAISQLTIDWIHLHYPNIFHSDRIYFAGIWDSCDHTSMHKTKAEIAKELGASYLIDDQLKHCMASAEIGIKTLLFGNYKWNQLEMLPPNVERVAGWADVDRFFADETRS